MILGILGSILSGGATGLLGTAIQRYADHKNKKLDYEHQLAMEQIKIAIADKEWAGKVEVADSEAFKVSLTSEPKLYGIMWLDVVRGLVRPVLTIYLCALTTFIYFKAQNVLNVEYLTVQNAYDLVIQIINTILYLTTTCVLFWFGTRNRGKQK